MGNNDFHNLQQLFNTGNNIMTANQKSSCNKNRPPNASLPNGNLNINTAMANNATNNNNNNGKSPFSFPFLSPTNQTAANPLSPINLPSMSGNSTCNNNNPSMLASPSISNQSHGGGFSLDRTSTATNNSPLESRNNSTNPNQMMNQSNSGSQNPSQQQQQQQLNSMLSQSRHLPFPYNLNNFHRNY